MSSQSLFVSFLDRPQELTDTAIFHDADKPPVAIAVVQKDHGITLGSIGLAIYGRDEIVQGIDKLEVNIFC